MGFVDFSTVLEVSIDFRVMVVFPIQEISLRWLTYLTSFCDVINSGTAAS